MNKETLSEKRKGLIVDISRLHTKSLYGKYIHYEDFRRLLDKVNEQDKQCFKDILERIKNIRQDNSILTDYERLDIITLMIKERIGEELLE